MDASKDRSVSGGGGICKTSSEEPPQNGGHFGGIPSGASRSIIASSVFLLVSFPSSASLFATLEIRQTARSKIVESVYHSPICWQVRVVLNEKTERVTDTIQSHLALFQSSQTDHTCDEKRRQNAHEENLSQRAVPFLHNRQPFFEQHGLPSEIQSLCWQNQHHSALKKGLSRRS